MVNNRDPVVEIYRVMEEVILSVLLLRIAYPLYESWYKRCIIHELFIKRKKKGVPK